MQKKVETSLAIVAVALISAFASRWVDKSLSLEFPWGILLLIISMVALFFMAYGMIGDSFNRS